MRYTFAAVTLATAVTASIVVSSPASAAALPPVTVNCTGGTLTLTANNFAAARLDTIDITNLSGGRFTSISAFGALTANTGNFDDGVTWNYEIQLNRGGNITFTTDPAGGGPCQGQSITLTFTGSGGSSSGTSSASTPTPIVQQFGRPASATCDAAAPATLNWSGVANGGWGESWAQWMNGGSGGAVCTRTLVYNTAQSRWVVG